MHLPGGWLPCSGHDVSPRVAAHVLVGLEAVAGEDGPHRLGDGGGAGDAVPGADDDLVVMHAARASCVAVEEDGEAVLLAELAQELVESRVVGVVVRAQALLEIGGGEGPRKEWDVTHGVGAHHAAARAHLAVALLEVIAPPVDVHEHARDRRREDGGAVLVEVTIDVAREGVREAVGEGLEARLAVVVPSDVRKGPGAEVGHAHQDWRPRARRRSAHDGKRLGGVHASPCYGGRRPLGKGRGAPERVQFFSWRSSKGAEYPKPGMRPAPSSATRGPTPQMKACSKRGMAMTLSRMTMRWMSCTFASRFFGSISRAWRI